MTLPTVSCQLQMVGQDELYEHIKDNAKYAKTLIQRDSHNGKTVIICGAGPSLSHHHDWLWETPAHHIWACNSALPYLKDHKLPVSHGFTVDQSIEMIGPAEWERTFDVTYLLGTCVDPRVRDHLLEAHRRIVWFHNYLGIKNPEDWQEPDGWLKPAPDVGYEMYLYQTLFAPTVQVGYGLNSVPRAMCLALWMGFSRILVVGADCATAPDTTPMPTMTLIDGENAGQLNPTFVQWINHLPLYASGRTVAQAYGDNAIVVQGMLDGRYWTTRTDMLITAQHMLDIEKSFPERVVLIGDTLPNALKTQTPEYLSQLPKLAGGGTVTGFGVHPDIAARLLDNQPPEAV